MLCIHITDLCCSTRIAKVKVFANKCQPIVGKEESEHLVTHENDRNVVHQCTMTAACRGTRELQGFCTLKDMAIASDPY